MRKCIFVLFAAISLSAYAQRQTEYNRKGDDAMERKDYRDAKMWYEEGVAYCDGYSIDQLTKIWQTDETMHVSMRTAMTKCLSCLNELATENDTAAIKKIIVYYEQGIGTTPNETSANYWKNQLEQLRQPFTGIASYTERTPRDKMHFFAGYHFSPLAPFGLQFGTFNNTFGWYIRLRSDFKTEDYAGSLTPGGKLELSGEIKYARDEVEYKPNSTLIASVGLMYSVIEDVYISAGAGYWKRDLLRKFTSVDDDGNAMSDFWMKDPEYSYKGAAVDIDAMVRFGGRFYGTAGFTVLTGNVNRYVYMETSAELVAQKQFKCYLYPNVGIGIYF
ncbi:MAG: hypothetical protein LBR50_01215 [Tannerella sp.]|jgi:hypothetical protein|nr:hypothetical protein [Tannerella sp.]